MFVRKSGMILTLLLSTQAFASVDVSYCSWGTENCVLTSPPFLSMTNDTRDNLLRLTADRAHIALTTQTEPPDISRSRDYYFAFHLDDWYTRPYKEDAEPVVNPVLDEQLKALNITNDMLSAAEFRNDDSSDRFASNNIDAFSQFYAAILADDALTSEQRTVLAKARLLTTGNDYNQKLISELPLPENSVAAQYRDYLLGANSFYTGSYLTAKEFFTKLKDAKHPWLAETATYMLMRTALNQSSEHANGRYGEFTVNNISGDAALEALSWADVYLKQWPEGKYAASTRGLLRRINWYLKDWDSLAKLYETEMQQAKTAEQLIALVAENDAKLQSKDLTQQQTLFISAPEAPLITFTQILRLLREQARGSDAILVDDALLEKIKPGFEASHNLPLWNYLVLSRHYFQQNYQSIVDAIVPATAPSETLLSFSEQVLYGKALMMLNQWPTARKHWLKLMTLNRSFEQQQYLQAHLAATEIYDNHIDRIFMPDSQVTNLRYRSLVLKTVASPQLLRQQAKQGPNKEEQTIALHTLLLKDLIYGNYKEWLDDIALQSHILQPVITKNFSDVNLAVFDWDGTDAEENYFCPALKETVVTLSKKPQDAHALNCLGEFFRTTNVKIDIESEFYGNDILDDAISDANSPATDGRQGYYQQIITDSKAEHEDKSFALYRAIMCYSPSGYNDCGGEDVDLLQRKGWFNQLKTQYPGSPWAQKLKYYW
ncbi:hypothetical protein [Enterobacter sp. KBR-315C3_2022]|uniref:hypothetical protein n=1 Tax=Enterobacter sp. KBR-315C3_2022 TaxID=3242494 RepID=UPI003528507B